MNFHKKSMKTFEFNEGQLLECVNNKAEEINFLNNNLFSKYGFGFVKISKDKTLSLKDYLNNIRRFDFTK